MVNSPVYVFQHLLPVESVDKKKPPSMSRLKAPVVTSQATFVRLHFILSVIYLRHHFHAGKQALNLGRGLSSRCF